MKKKHYLIGIAVLIAAGIAIALILLNKDKKTDETIQYSERVAKLVSRVTNGNISAKDPIRISFADTVVSKKEVGKVLEETVFDFKPSLKGEAKWVTQRIIEFEPEDLDYNQDYRGELYLNKLSAAFKKEDYEPLIFKFFVEGRVMDKFQGDLFLKDREDPRELFYRGEIDFSIPAEIEKVKEAIELKEGNKSYELKWGVENGGKTFRFSSEFIERTNNGKDFEFTIDKKPLDLSKDFEKEFSISGLQDMKVMQVHKVETGRTPRVKLEFSDALRLEQDISGLVTVEPKVDSKIKKLGKNVFIDGDFKFGKSYTIKVLPGIKSKWATKTKKEFSAKIEFADLKPMVEFASGGMILPSDNEQKLQFFSCNLERVHVEIKRIFPSQVTEFIDDEKLSSDKDRKTGFSNSYVNRVGVIVFNKTLEIGKKKNEWLLNQMDLKPLINEYENGIFLVRVNFNPNDILTDQSIDDSKLKYIQESGQIYKPLTLSDIGITFKRSDDKRAVYTTNLQTAEPMSNITVTLYNSYGRKLDQERTNSKGYARFSRKSYISRGFVTAEYGNQMSILKLREMEWNTSGFDIGGAHDQSDRTRAFIYTERGVYRPGDEINLSAIIRNSNNTFPDNHPVELTVYNPKGQSVISEVNKEGVNGFYSFSIKTEQGAPTGNWRARIEAGNRNFYHTLKIETVVPDKLKVKIESEQEKITWKDNFLKFNINSEYLFGAPASNLKAEAEIDIQAVEKTFPKYEDYSFTDKSADFKSIQSNIYTGRLTKEGEAYVEWKLPPFYKVPSALRGRLLVTVFDKGSRPNKGWKFLDIEPYSHYVGMKKPGGRYSYMSTGNEVRIPVIVLDTKGKPAVGRTLHYRIYRNSSNWWYEYDSRNKFKLRFKSDKQTTLVKEGDLHSAKDAADLTFIPSESGEYFVEVQDKESEHTSGFFMRAYAYGQVPASDRNAGTLALRSDKKKYDVGENIKVKFPVPEKGQILLSVERGDEILRSDWYSAKSNKAEKTISIPVTKNMVPNAYVSVSLIQPHAQTKNDRPVRLYGILPVEVIDPETTHEIDISMPDELKPQQSFQIDLQAMDYKQKQLTVAVVDEGLLSLTNFQTPDPFKEFFKKLRLGVSTYDNFAEVIGVNQGDIFKTFSIGGGMSYRESQLAPGDESKKRFKPVCLFKGPIMTDNNGKASVTFDMPDYVGAVRVMVISAQENSYGHAEKSVPVKSDLMMVPTLPRVLGPDEEFVLPVSVFAMKENIGKVNIIVDTEGPFKTLQKNNQELFFEGKDTKECFFKLKTLKAAGQGSIFIKSKAKDFTYTTRIDINVRPTSARIYDSEEKPITPGATVSMNIPGKGIDGTNRASLRISPFPNMNISHRVHWLIRYPYGCIEQTTSSVLPQLYLKPFIKGRAAGDESIDHNINAGIQRLRKFQRPSGGFSYWPGGSDESEWGSNYATHFLVEAKKLGYHVPDDMYDRSLDYLQREARRHNGKLTVRVNRVYILARAGKRQMSEMNQLLERQLGEMNNTQKYMLAAAYKLSTNVKGSIDKILKNASKSVRDYKEFGGTYGSMFRDRAIILSSLVDMDKLDEARPIVKELALELSSDNWHSTQTLGYSLLALGKYYDRFLEGETRQLKGEVTMPDGKVLSFDEEGSY